jgi:hypothetical protein
LVWFLEGLVMLVGGGATVRSISGRWTGPTVLAGVLATLVMACTASLAGALPAGWSYELVSPADPLQSDVSYGVAAPQGDHAWFQTITPMIDGQPSGNITTVAATRIAGVGWQSVSLAEPGAPGVPSYWFMASSEDASRVVVQSCDQTFLGCRGAVTFQRISQNGARTTMLSVPRSSFFDPVPLFAGSSSDLSRIFVQNADASTTPPILAADTHIQGQGLYASHDGHVEFVGYDQNGTVLPCGEVLANNATAAGNGTGFEQNGLSADGTTVVFESPDPNAINNDPADCPGPIDVYARRGGQSFDISAPTNANPNLGATYVGNTRDGNTVYFVTTSQLVASDTDTDPDIYAANMTTPTPTITRITPDANIAQGGSGPAVTVSPGGDFVYFEATNQINGQGTVGEPNLYVYHAGAITFIATASSGHFALGQPLTSGSGSPVTPDGRHLVFLTPSPLTGQPTGGRRMIFQYTFGAGIKCVSCRPDGNPPTLTDPGTDQLVNANPPAQLDQRVQSDDGKRVFFNTLEPLLPQDISPAIDVYMWEDNGTPNGKLTLISTGRSNHGSGFVGASADGNSVLFTTYDRLLPGVGQDTKKVYAARLNGGFPATPAQAAECAGDACRGMLSLPPVLTGISTAVADGRGNPPSGGGSVVRLVVGKISRNAQLRLARNGALTLALRATGADTIRTSFAARIGGRYITSSSASRKLGKAGSVRIALHLSTRARTYLAKHHTLHVRITINDTATGTSRRINFTLHTAT